MWSPQKGPTRLWDLRFSLLFILQLMSISPGGVNTNIMGKDYTMPEGMPILQPADLADAILFSLKTPPHVQIHELTIRSVGELV